MNPASRQFRQRDGTGGWPALSPRQAEISELVARGFTNDQIGAALGLTEHTVRNHLSRLFPKLGIRNRAKLAALQAAGQLEGGAQ